MYIPFSEISIPRGITAVIGSGGKTTFLRKMAAVLPGKVILTTTTHICPFAGLPLILTEEGEPADSVCGRISSALEKHRILTLGAPAGGGKLCSPAIPFNRLPELVDYVLAEADGSRSLPLKAHRSFEPVIPAESSLTICLVGASGINERIGEVCHCSSVFCRISGTDPGQSAAPGHIACVLNAENLADVYLINQADLPEKSGPVLELCSKIKKPAAAGSLQQFRFL